MSVWAWQGWVGIFGGALVFIVTLVPTLLLQIRQFGRVSLRRVLGAAAVSVYAVALAAYTLLPLPAQQRVCSPGGTPIELTPGHSLSDIARETSGLTLSEALTSFAVLQVVMNVILFVPLGAIARRYWHRGIVTSIIIGALLSVLIEATQYTAVWGIYNCAYRLADVDDVIANTAGAAIGALIAPLLLFWMPSAGTLRARRDAPRPVTSVRRWLGMLLDAVLVQICLGVISLVIAALGKITGDAIADGWAAMARGLITLALVVLLPASIGSGASVGQRFLWLEPSWPNHKASTLRRWTRASVIGIPYVLFESLRTLPGGALQSISFAWGIISLITFFTVLAAVISVPLTSERRGLSYLISHANIVDARSTSGASSTRRAASPPRVD
ncbi:VanZ family protein [Microbacterium foliorum]|uniref:VanZ family protein n=1 Tax=Microbacterium foliorum TaxID=104336 RepID=UPI001DC96F92|nr:VanZ family protein [Microbacterium foliorum]CAH0139367.1 hypothetical protein SRABI44_00435 [Microbacterium foliorum]CAH0189527.1 hypothetical protein SRABI03_01701 [Microbacterium foliorum]